MQHVVGQRKQVLEKREEDLGDRSQTAYGNLFLFKWKTNEFLPGDDREFLFRIFLYFCGAVFWFKDERKIKFQARIIQDETIALLTSGPHWFNLQTCKQNWDWMSLKLIQTCICMRSGAPTTPLTSFSIWICLQVCISLPSGPFRRLRSTSCSWATRCLDNSRCPSFALCTVWSSSSYYKCISASPTVPTGPWRAHSFFSQHSLSWLC